MIPQFGLLSHVSFLRLSSAHLGPVLTLSTDDAASASLSIFYLLVADVSLWATSLLAVAVRCVFCGVCVCVCVFSPSYVVLSDSKTHHRPVCERVSCLETSHPSQLPLQDGVPSLTLLSLFLSFIFCPTSFLREWVAFLGAWCPLPTFRSCFVLLFCGSCSKWYFHEFVGEKVVSLSFPLPS